jgi:molybdopterin-biosynthesis enzyme MoeA-like protein
MRSSALHLRLHWIRPTHGDITADCVAKAFGVPINTDPRALAIPARVGKDDRRRERGRLRMTRNPKGAESHPQQGVGGAWLLDRQWNRDGGRALIMQAMLDQVAP